MNLNLVEITEDPGTPMAQVEMREIRRNQMADRVIGKWRIAVIDGQQIEKTFTKEDQIMKRNFKSFRIKRGILFREIEENEEKIEQLVVPECYRQDILKGLHTDIGHPGIERTTRLIRQRFFWPGMTSDIENLVKQCDRCLRRKSATNTRAPLVNINTTYPLELVCFDFLSLETSKGGYSNILVITDHFSKFAIAVPTRNQTAKTTAEAFFSNFIVKYGIPTRLHSDQGANFESDLIKELCQLMKIKKSHTTVYHPQGNSGPKRFNRTLLSMLGTLENWQKPDWKKYIDPLVFAYNCTPHESTKVSPFELMFLRKPKLPIDAMFELAGEAP
jgi:transposase InsO family protein